MKWTPAGAILGADMMAPRACPGKESNAPSANDHGEYMVMAGAAVPLKR